MKLRTVPAARSVYACCCVAGRGRQRPGSRVGGGAGWARRAAAGGQSKRSPKRAACREAHLLLGSRGAGLALVAGQRLVHRGQLVHHAEQARAGAAGRQARERRHRRKAGEQGRRTAPPCRTWRRSRRPQPSATRRCAPPPTPASPCAAGGPRLREASKPPLPQQARRRPERRKATKQRAPRAHTGQRGHETARRRRDAAARGDTGSGSPGRQDSANRELTAMPSRAKFTPSAGSGSSGGTSSAGSSTCQVPSGRPYKQRFSLFGSACA